VASDFCGYKKEQKQTGGLSAANIGEHACGEPSIFDASFGGNWAEQMLPVVYHDGVNMGRITLPRLVQVMCENPAKIFGLYPQKGTLQPGADADIVIFDPAQEHTLSAADQHTNADFTMFEGKQVIGKPVFSMQRGEVLIENGELRRPRGRAKYLPGKPELAAYAKGGHSVQ
jgi:dihydropyrimidinase